MNHSCVKVLFVGLIIVSSTAPSEAVEKAGLVLCLLPKTFLHDLALILLTIVIKLLAVREGTVRICGLKELVLLLTKIHSLSFTVNGNEAGLLFAAKLSQLLKLRRLLSPLF